MSLMTRGEGAKSEYHFGESVEEFRRQLFLAVSAEQFYISEDLGLIFFLGKTSVRVLSEVGRDDSIFSYLKKVFVIPAERAGQSVGNGGFAARHREAWRPDFQLSAGCCFIPGSWPSSRLLSVSTGRCSCMAVLISPSRSAPGSTVRVPASIFPRIEPPFLAVTIVA